MSHKKKRCVSIIILVFILVFLVVYVAYQNKNLETNYYEIESENIPNSFESFKIAQISDLHNCEIGKDNKRLISKLKEASPDIIVVTGDLIDSRNTKIDIAVNLMEEATKIAPCYFVSGNHEGRMPLEYEELKNKLSELNVTILENTSVNIEKNGEFISVAGIKDPVYYADLERPEMTENSLKAVKQDDSYNVLLSHRPELFELYVKHDFDLVFTGHAHGGQFRLPFIGGLFAPHQGKFPEYDSGLYKEAETNMLVSRGIGNSLFPFRVNNRPEVIIAQLKTK